MRLTPTRIFRAAASQSTKSYSSTLHLPKSTFPARPPLKQPSPYLPTVTEDLYKWNVARDDSTTKGTFVLHDGPPYANGTLHIGHALNKVLKDIINRFQVSQGKKVHYVPGWDCHGLPIEIKALQSKSGSGKDVPPVEVRKAARALAERTVKIQMEGFKQWGVMGDWDKAYRSMDKSFELRQLSVFRGMVEKGLIYRQHKPVYWSPSSRTALAESELEYADDHQSTAAYVAFPLVERPPRFQRLDLLKDACFVIWTTTPWTLPANRAIAVNEELFYCLIEITNSAGKRQKLIIEESCLEDFFVKTLIPKTEPLVMSMSGTQLVGAKYGNPLSPGSAQPVLHADFVMSTSGTGLVHMAPGHGMEDYNVCRAQSIPAFAPVDDEGHFTEAAYRVDPAVLTGKDIQSDGIDAVLHLLKALGTQYGIDFLLGTHPLRHRYPIDWRTKLSVIVRATEQWFADVESVKDTALQAISDVNFIPSKGRARLEAFTKSRSQWCISRQRAWGVPIPALYRVDDDSKQAVMDEASISHIMDVIQERGTDAWWTDAEDDVRWVPPYLQGQYVRGKDTMDVWFDSGTTWTMLEHRRDGKPVADVYLEGSDQHRGWFQSSLLTHVSEQAQTDGEGNVFFEDVKAPFSTLITHGFTLDQEGKKMSKSLGNVIEPKQIIDGSLLPPVQGKGKKSKQQAASADGKPVYDAMGPDALRLWAASSDYTTDVVVGTQVLENVHKSLQKYRITFKWLLGALADYKNDHAHESTTISSQLADRIALHQLHVASRAVHESYTSFEFYKATKLLETYVNNDLSAFYFETLKDRLYTGMPDDRLAAQATLYVIFEELLKMLAPITPFMVEEVWQHMPHTLKEINCTSPLRREWTPYLTPWSNEITQVEKLEAQIAEVDAIHAAVKAAAEDARRAGKMGTSLDCDVHVHVPTEIPSTSILRRPSEELASLFVTSAVEVHANDSHSPKTVEAGATDTAGEAESWHFAAPMKLSWAKEEGRVTVTRPKGGKCARCWRWVVSEGESDVCGRCEEAVRSDAHKL